jgi:Protein of unknown function (DUF3891)
MFRSKRRPVVYPQSEHALFSALIAAAWGNERFERPNVPFDAFVRGVALHDRGYGELDDDPIGGVPTERWLEIQWRSFQPRGLDPVVDVVVAFHVRRLVSWSRGALETQTAAEMSEALPALLATAGVSEADAQAADVITNFCDSVAFDFCLEQPDSGRVGGIEYAVDGEGGVKLSPWPLGVQRVDGVLLGYEAEGYPKRLEPVVQLFRIEPT